MIVLNEAGAVPVGAYVVVNEWNKPLLGFDNKDDALDWARDCENYLGQYGVREAGDETIKYSWRNA